MTRPVMVGGVQIGGDANISIQSMTNTDTRDIKATVNQIKRLEDAGCEIARFSVYDMECAESIQSIKAMTRIPLVADIHFDYRLAIASINNGIDKIRFNPGNIGDADRVKKLVKCAKEHCVPIRVGVNGGSLERDLLLKYGRPSPEALVESAKRHVDLLLGEGFDDIVVSLKASNVIDTVKAYRLMSDVCVFPLHVGVTEAGFGESAVVKSAIGIGTLLLDGIGDTIRVSITGDPIDEVKAAKEILRALERYDKGIEIISCPTCGRCCVDLESIARQVESELSGYCTDKTLKVAVMGCAVNGPGEAREADIGIAFGSDRGVLFKKDEVILNAPQREAVDALISEARRIAGGGTWT